jgi:hypothetical protein
LTASKGTLRIAGSPSSEWPLFPREIFLMAIYMVERSLKGITMDQLGAAQKSAIETGKKMTATGKKVRYIRSTFVPDEARCMCLFEATGPELVRELNEEAKIPFTRIVEALDLTP